MFGPGQNPRPTPYLVNSQVKAVRVAGVAADTHGTVKGRIWDDNEKTFKYKVEFNGRTIHNISHDDMDYA